MVNPHRNGPEMTPYDAPDSDQLEELQELNLLFLIYLRSCAREGGDCLGIPTGTAARLRELSMTALQAMSDFPRSLFNVDLDNISAAREHFELPRTALEQSRQALTLTVLHSAWNMSRSREFQARMFLRLSATATRRLRTIPLSELPLLAVTPGRLACAFPGARALWITLISRTETEMPRALRMIALHPDAEFRPVRRPISLRQI
jgi:hypothetical protein